MKKRKTTITEQRINLYKVAGNSKVDYYSRALFTKDEQMKTKQTLYLRPSQHDNIHIALAVSATTTSISALLCFSLTESTTSY